MDGLAFLTLAVVFCSGVAITMKVVNAQKIDLGQFLAVNYLVCTAALLAWGSWRTLWFNPPLVWLLGIVVGILYVLTLWLFDKSISASGLALSTTLMRLSAAIPTIGSWILFAEQTNGFQVIGIALTFLCLPLAGKAPQRTATAGKPALCGAVWGLLLFGAYGVTDFLFKVQAELAPSAHQTAFMTTIFGTALVLTFPKLVGKTGPDLRCLKWGGVMGATNVLATYFLIRALNHLPGTVVYPTVGLGVIAVSTIAGLIIWQERLRRANVVFLVLACAAVFLINLC